MCHLLTVLRDIDIVFKKILEGLHEFNYHYERYESINTEDDSDNQREKEKLENDLKKEIKRLQKFREQIKIWQSNDYIKTLALSGNSLCNKLTENKRSIEEAMETYKDVERSSKLKTFSNQSILLSTIDQQNSLNRDSDYDEDDSDNLEDLDIEELLSETEEEDLEEHLPLEYIESIKYIKEIINKLNNQTQKLNHEFEKLSQKKLRKNNLGTIEAKKEKITATLNHHKFYIKKLLKIIKFMKNSKLTEINLFVLIKDDLNKYVETNDNYDANLFDDIFNSVTAEEDYSEMNDSEIYSTPSKSSRDELTSLVTSSNGILNNNSDKQNNITSHTLNTNSYINNHTNNNINHYKNGHSNTSLDVLNGSFEKSFSSSIMTTDPGSPAILKSLKPASTPSKPVGNLKWSTAAAAGISDTAERSSASQTPEPSGSPKQIIPSPSKSVPINKPDINDPNYAYVELLKKSSLALVEINLFSDLNLLKVPPGIQDLVLSFAAKRNSTDDCKLIYDSETYNQFVTPIRKPYLPQPVQPLLSTPSSFKPPLQLFKLQSYWNRIRANNQFGQFLTEIENLNNTTTVDNSAIVNELTLVFFYGYHYGLTPIENLIAESCLFKLGWKPYKTKVDGTSALDNQSTLLIDQTNNTFLFWFKRMKLISAPTLEDQTNIEIGDYQVFDLSAWEIHVKYGFKFDYHLCQLEPSKVFH